MSRIKSEILNKAFEIGFTFNKQPHWDKPSISLPCSVILDNRVNYEMAELILLDEFYNPVLFTAFSIEQVSEIQESKFALSNFFRKESLKAQEYRNDWPFFIRKKDNKILGFNAFSPVNFTYNENLLGSEIVEVVSFDRAQEEKFEFIRNHDEIPIKILCGYDEVLAMKIEKINN